MAFVLNSAMVMPAGTTFVRRVTTVDGGIVATAQAAQVFITAGLFRYVTDE